jgi:hypothetical protein
MSELNILHLENDPLDSELALDSLREAERRNSTREFDGGIQKMPRRTGMEVLEWLRQQENLRSLPVIVCSLGTGRRY